MDELCKDPKLSEGEVAVLSQSYILVRYRGKYHLFENRCSHEDFPLQEGFVDADEGWIECPKHGARFSLLTGDALTLPATKPIVKYKIEEKDSYLYIVNTS